MKRKINGRIAKGVPISFDPEELEMLEERLAELGRKVSSRSHYFQVLLAMDSQYDIIGKGITVVDGKPTVRK